MSMSGHNLSHEGHGHGHEGHGHNNHGEGGHDGHGHSDNCCNGHSHDGKGEGHSHAGHAGHTVHAVYAEGKPVATPAAFTEYPVTMPATITPQYAAALLNSPSLLGALSKYYFRKYDRNSNGILELGEIKVLCDDLHMSLGLSFSHIDDESIKTSIMPFSQGAQALQAKDFPAWFRTVMQNSVSATALEEQQAQFEVTDMQVMVKELSGQYGQEYALYGFSNVLPSIAVGTLREIAASHLDIPVGQTRLTIGEEVLPDSATMGELHIGPDSEIRISTQL